MRSNLLHCFFLLRHVIWYQTWHMLLFKNFSWFVFPPKYGCFLNSGEKLIKPFWAFQWHCIFMKLQYLSKFTYFSAKNSNYYILVVRINWEVYIVTSWFPWKVNKASVEESLVGQEINTPVIDKIQIFGMTFMEIRKKIISL